MLIVCVGPSSARYSVTDRFAVLEILASFVPLTIWPMIFMDAFVCAARLGVGNKNNGMTTKLNASRSAQDFTGLASSVSLSPRASAQPRAQAHLRSEFSPHAAALLLPQYVCQSYCH